MIKCGTKLTDNRRPMAVRRTAAHLNYDNLAFGSILRIFSCLQVYD